MSEEDRTHVYAWLCEEIGKRRADYVMSRLAPAPLSDLVTKDHLETQFALHRTELTAQREADRKEAAAQREADRIERETDRKEAAALREADRKEAAAQREADRGEVKQRFRWTIGTLIASNGLLVGAVGAIVGLA